MRNAGRWSNDVEACIAKHLSNLNRHKRLVLNEENALSLPGALLLALRRGIVPHARPTVSAFPDVVERARQMRRHAHYRKIDGDLRA